ncbi:MAG: RHS repeat-associated core domain-containing protein, partial [Lachnospiraceae bacterium]|nr:RHS repeat-associated core domain-containing protein [Lachnospiraceae bacterium]
DVDTVEETEYNYNGLDQLTESTKTTKNPKVGASQTEVVTTYTYDKKGNEIKESVGGKDKTTSVYDVMNNLVSATVTEETKTVITSNEYDGSGQRIKKTVEKTKGTKKETNYYYGNGGVLYTTDAKGEVTTENIHGVEGQTFATVRSALANGTNQTSEDQTGENKGYIYSKDIRGSVTAVVGELKEVNRAEVAYDYTDYGETTQLITDTTFENEICYTGGIYDESTGLYYLNARHYDPENARFMTQDTYRGEDEEPDSWNLYMYCAGNPVVYTDPSGHKKKRKKPWYSKKKGTVYNTFREYIRIDTDGKTTKKMKKNNYYGDKVDRAGETACFSDWIAADQIPYIVVPESMGAYKWSVGVIVNEKNGNYLYCVVADTSVYHPNESDEHVQKGVGEASIYAAWKMGKKSKTNSSLKGEWRFVIFQKSAPSKKTVEKKKIAHGWKCKSVKKLRKQIKKEGKKCYKGTGKCLN